MPHRRFIAALLGAAALAAVALAGEDEPLPPIAADRELQHLPDPDGPGGPRAAVLAAGHALGDWPLKIAGVELDGPRLVELAGTSPEEPFLRVVREELRRAFDVDDLVYMLDDVLVAGEGGRRGEPFTVPSGRARAAGVLLHPEELFEARPRVYPNKPRLAVDAPQPPRSYTPADDGDLLGPEWTARYPNPSERDAMMKALAEARPEADFAARLEDLMAQIEAQGGEAWVASTLRSRHRGYLIWGSFLLSRASSEAELDARVELLEDRDEAWGLEVPIAWRHPDGWEATVEAARRMADAYDVVYATEQGARSSNHYDAVAADLVVLGLPRSLTLTAPDGAEHTFDLSDPWQARDLSLTPEVIDWVEEHFGLRKLRSDYPHWDDALTSG